MNAPSPAETVLLLPKRIVRWAAAPIHPHVIATRRSIASFMKHVRTLESSGLIHTTKNGRVRTCALNRERLALIDDWLAGERRIWEDRTDRLEQFVTNPKENS